MVEGEVVNTPDLPDWDKWIPAVGDTVWLNAIDGPPLGVCVGFLRCPGRPRHGQPIIEYRGDDDPPGMFMGKKHGERSVVHPTFLWPFAVGSPEHKAAERSGRFG